MTTKLTEELGTEIDPQVLDVADEIPVEKLTELDDAKFQYLREKYLRG